MLVSGWKKSSQLCVFSDDFRGKRQTTCAPTHQCAICDPRATTRGSLTIFSRTNRSYRRYKSYCRAVYEPRAQHRALTQGAWYDDLPIPLALSRIEPFPRLFVKSVMRPDLTRIGGRCFGRCNHTVMIRFETSRADGAKVGRFLACRDAMFNYLSTLSVGSPFGWIVIHIHCVTSHSIIASLKSPTYLFECFISLLYVPGLLPTNGPVKGLGRDLLLCCRTA